MPRAKRWDIGTPCGRAKCSKIYQVTRYRGLLSKICSVFCIDIFENYYQDGNHLDSSAKSVQRRRSRSSHHGRRLR